MGDVVKVNWSGGKDSTVAVLLHLARGDRVKVVCYVPMFTDDIPLIQKEHYQFILSAADYFRSLGASVWIVSGITYCDYVCHRAVRGKYKGLPFGFPCVGRGKCGFKRDSKLKALSSVDVGFFDYEDIGIACDEVQRFGSLSHFRRSILLEEQFSEFDCFRLAFYLGLLSPRYSTSFRDGCSLCPHAPFAERSLWLSQYPAAKPILIQLQDFVFSERTDRYPLRGCRLFVNSDGSLN